MLHTPLQELQDKTTSSEFLQWCAYMRLEAEHPGALSPNNYTARIAAELRAIATLLSGSRKPTKVSEFIYPFGAAPKPGHPPAHTTPPLDSKTSWCVALNITPL